MAKKTLEFIVSTVGTNDKTQGLNLPLAVSRFKARADALTLFPDNTLLVSFEDNDWKNATHVPPANIEAIARERLDRAKQPGIDVFVKGKGRKSPTIRIRSAEKYAPAQFNYTGEISAPLRKLCEDLWAEFGDDPSLYNGGVHVCRRIAGSSSWSQHSWDDAIDLMIGSDMNLGDQIYRWLKKNEHKYGGFCELLWRVASHYDHIHVSLSPCHSGTPPCA